MNALWDIIRHTFTASRVGRELGQRSRPTSVPPPRAFVSDRQRHLDCVLDVTGSIGLYLPRRERLAAFTQGLTCSETR